MVALYRFQKNIWKKIWTSENDELYTTHDRRSNFMKIFLDAHKDRTARTRRIKDYLGRKIGLVWFQKGRLAFEGIVLDVQAMKDILELFG